MAPSRHDWKIVDWDVKPQHNQPTNFLDVKYLLGRAVLAHYVRVPGLSPAVGKIISEPKHCFVA